jgi:hypothetical protein
MVVGMISPGMALCGRNKIFFWSATLAMAFDGCRRDRSWHGLVWV